MNNFYMQILKAEKDADNLTVIFTHLGSACVKASGKINVKENEPRWQKVNIGDREIEKLDN